MLLVILMAHPPSTAIKDGIHYFPVILATGFLGGAGGAAPPGAWGSSEGEAGDLAACRAVLAQCLSGEMLWSVPCEAWARKHSYKASSSASAVAVPVKTSLSFPV